MSFQPLPSVASVTVTPAQVSQLHATPVTLVPAPGVGMVLEVESVELYLPYNSTPYVTQNSQLEVGYSVAGLTQVFSAVNLFDATSSQRRLMRSFGSDAGGVNEALVLHMSAPVSGGNSPLKVVVTYRIRTAIV